ncbi:MAG TPA: 1,4-dihydroxy-2-naphthoate octaprenyltransferase [Oligoflexia bacterium]|nr:1,4-dihydroxy-2-naphthoate octaprenyltransferase [Oligoflexia bacterium]
MNESNALERNSVLSPRTNNDLPGFLRTWWIAVRPFSFPASAVPVAFGTAAAAATGGAEINWGHFLLALFGMMMLQGAANIINDIYDFSKGIDREVYPVSGAVVRHLITPDQAKRGALLLIVCGSLIGLYLSFAAAWQVLIIGMAGIATGIFYSTAPFGLKYRALGDCSVFLAFGILGSLGAWVVQTGEMSWVPVVWAIPQSLLIIAILHANNWRDIAGDSAGGFTTVASLLGDEGSARYYSFLLFSPFALIVALMTGPRFVGLLPPLPHAFVLTFLALPLALRLTRKASRRHTNDSAEADFVALDGATAQLSLVFGLLTIAALLISRWVN